MKHRILRTMSLLCMCITLYGQWSVPKASEDYFSSPVRHPIRLGGTFCELRGDHFHAGIDIKSKRGVSGDSVFAVAPGYVRRLKVQSSGYGQTIYIDHPVGLTSVYAHLDLLAPDLAKYVDDAQHAQKSFEVDLEPDSTTFAIKRGQFIGFMGNKGYSFGPHLHFEIRSKDTEVPINPMYYGFISNDHVPPIISRIKWSGISPSGRPYSGIKPKLLRPSEGVYSTAKDTLVLPFWRAGLSIQTYDLQDKSWNKNGIYALTVIADSDTIYRYLASHCSFEKTHQINAHLDYEERIVHNEQWYRCYQLPGNDLPFYSHSKKLGALTLTPDRPTQVQIVVEDFNGNRSICQTWAQRQKEIPPYHSENYHALFARDRSNHYIFGHIGLNTAKDAVYYDTPIQVKVTPDANPGHDLLQLGTETDPLKKNMEVHLPSSFFPQEPLKKYHVEHYQTRKKSWISLGGQWENGEFIFSTPYLGKFRVSQDDTPPTIKVKFFKKEVSRSSAFQFIITDDARVIKGIRNPTFSVQIDQQWALAEYDYKNDLVVIPLDNLDTGIHHIEITATDFRGNTSQWTSSFSISSHHHTGSKH